MLKPAPHERRRQSANLRIGGWPGDLASQESCGDGAGGSDHVKYND